MVNRINLSDISQYRLGLLTITAHKISLNKHTNLNQDFDANLRVDIDVIKKLLETIESRIRKMEMIYFSFLETADHTILTGNTSNLPVKLEFEFSYDTSVIKETIEINDKDAYKEIVNLNFQHFILLVASLLENSVRLSEILVKKVIVHKLGDKPISTPMLSYISFFESLIKLGYRVPDHISGCLTNHDPFLKKTLDPINRLRNAFIHGFQPHLESDGFNYRINQNLANTFSPGSPDLNVDAFSKLICDGVVVFIRDLLASLASQIKHHKKSIPA